MNIKNKLEKWFIMRLCPIVIFLIVIEGVYNNRIDITDTLIFDTVNLCLSVTLAIAAIAISIFQSDERFYDKSENKEDLKNKNRKYFLNMFFYTVEILFVYITTRVYGNYIYYLKLSFFIVTTATLNFVLRTFEIFNDYFKL